MRDALLSSLLLEAGGIGCLQKKKREGFNRLRSVNIKWNKKGENMTFSRAWQKIE